jgi:hypothetical protein
VRDAHALEPAASLAAVFAAGRTTDATRNIGADLVAASGNAGAALEALEEPES